jgi:hypothetical protein
MNFIENRINATTNDTLYKFQEYCPAIAETVVIKTQRGNILAKDIKIGDKLTTGSEVSWINKK